VAILGSIWFGLSGWNESGLTGGWEHLTHWEEPMANPYDLAVCAPSGLESEK